MDLAQWLAAAPAPPPGFGLCPHRSWDGIYAYESLDGTCHLYLHRDGKVTAADGGGWLSGEFDSLERAAATLLPVCATTAT